MIDRRRLLKLSAAATLAPGIASPAIAQSTWPNKPVRILIPFTPGGGADTIARFVALKMTEVLGQQFLVESKPGPADHSVLSLDRAFAHHRREPIGPASWHCLGDV